MCTHTQATTYLVARTQGYLWSRLTKPHNVLVSLLFGDESSQHVRECVSHDSTDVSLGIGVCPFLGAMSVT